jgi:hypothetical protein
MATKTAERNGLNIEWVVSTELTPEQENDLLTKADKLVKEINRESGEIIFVWEKKRTCKMMTVFANSMGGSDLEDEKDAIEESGIYFVNFGLDVLLIRIPV